MISAIEILNINTEDLLTFGRNSLYHGSEDMAFPNAEPSLPSKSLLRLYKKASRRDQRTGCRIVQKKDLGNARQHLAHGWLIFPTLSKYFCPTLRPRYLEKKPYNLVSDNHTPDSKLEEPAREAVSLTADNPHQPRAMRILYRNHLAYALQQQ